MQFMAFRMTKDGKRHGKRPPFAVRKTAYWQPLDNQKVNSRISSNKECNNTNII